MRKLNLKYYRDRNGWNVEVDNNGEIKELFFPTREQAVGFKNFCEWIYKLGRMDEYKDNVANSQKLMEKFGL